MIRILLSSGSHGRGSRLRRAIEKVVDLRVFAKRLERLRHLNVELLFKDILLKFFFDRIEIGDHRFGASEAEHRHPVFAHLDNFRKFVGLQVECFFFQVGLSAVLLNRRYRTKVVF